MAKVAFETVKSVSYEQYKLFNGTQEQRKTLEVFNAALISQAARSELRKVQEQLNQDLFSLRMGSVTVKID